MLTEWILVIWINNSYPMGGVGSTAPTILDRFPTRIDCETVGRDWAYRWNTHADGHDWACIKVQNKIETKETK